VRWQQVAAVVSRVEPDIVRLLEERQVEPAAASALLEEIVTLLLYRWNEVASPDAWLLQILEQRLTRLSQPPADPP
jgi:hypothetical protein